MAIPQSPKARKTTLTLGINAAFHDSAACLIRDGRVLAAVEEERFTGIKHGKRPIPFSAFELPFNAVDYCLARASVQLDDLDHVAYSFNPMILTGELTGHETVTLPLEPSRAVPDKSGESPWEQLFLSHVVNAPRHLRSGYPLALQERFLTTSEQAQYEWRWIDHHLAHAASAFLPSPFDEAAVMCLDGRGETATTSYWFGSGRELSHISQVNLPHSLGLMYEQATEHLGFLHSSDEYKVMALASYGKPSYAPALRRSISLGKSGSYTVDRIDWEKLAGPRRLRGERLQGHHFDLASSVQVVLEETVLALADWLRSETDAESLCLAGGVALNCVMNSKIRDSGLFSNVWVQPAAGDAGTALGSALWVDAKIRQYRQAASEITYFGPEFDNAAVEDFICQAGLSYEQPADLPQTVAEILARGRVVAWFQGRMEFGPRALGSRSILASPTDEDMQAKLNQIKDREDFRPVAPVVLEERMHEWFSPTGPSPYMLFIHDVLPDKTDRIPAVRHVDGTARIQTVRREQNPPYYDLISRFAEITGVPILVNTSFNTRGKPIVCTPRDAVECFMTSPIDALVIGPFVLMKPDSRLTPTLDRGSRR